MDVVAANFPDDATATEAADDLSQRLHVDPDFITVDHLGPNPGSHTGEPLLVIWIDAGHRVEARK